MKSIFVFLFGIFTSIFAFANSNFCTSSLELHVPNNAPFKVRIDGQIYNDLFAGAVLRDIPSGKRYLKVVQFRNNRKGHHRNGNRHHRGGGQQTEMVVLFEGYVLFNDCQRVVAGINQRNQFQIRDVINKRPAPNCQNFPMVSLPPNQFVDNYYLHPDNHWNGGNNNNNQGCSPNNQGNNNHYYPEENYNNAPAPMSNGAFKNLTRAIEDRNFDSNRFEVAQMGIEQNFFTSAQVKRLCRLFSYDNNRLKVAQMAYHKVIDPQNYTTIFEVFTFDNSVDKLVDYMQKNN